MTQLGSQERKHHVWKERETRTTWKWQCEAIERKKEVHLQYFGWGTIAGSEREVCLASVVAGTIESLTAPS
jgi:hypothetical protein